MDARYRTGDEAERFTVMGVAVTVLASGEDTGGAYTLLGQSVPPGAGSPPHTLPDDKVILVLDGSWGVLIHRRELSEEEYRGERFRDHGRDVKGDPDLRRIPIVVLTTSRAEEDIYRSYDLGVNSFVSKPVTFSGMTAVIPRARRCAR